MLGWIVNALVRDNNNGRKVPMPGLLDRYRELPFDELRKLATNWSQRRRSIYEQMLGCTMGPTLPQRITVVLQLAIANQPPSRPSRHNRRSLHPMARPHTAQPAYRPGVPTQSWHT